MWMQFKTPKVARISQPTTGLTTMLKRADENFNRNLQTLKYVKYLEKNKQPGVDCPICLELPILTVSHIIVWSERRNSSVNIFIRRNAFWNVVIKCVSIVLWRWRKFILSTTGVIHAGTFNSRIIHTCKTFYDRSYTLQVIIKFLIPELVLSHRPAKQ